MKENEFSILDGKTENQRSYEASSQNKVKLLVLIRHWQISATDMLEVDK